MNTESCDCRRVEYGQPAETKCEPGDFCWDEDRTHIYVVLPGTTWFDALKVNRGEPGAARVWGWDGNEDKPTLKPSILCPGYWHGHLIAGRLVSD